MTRQTGDESPPGQGSCSNRPAAQATDRASAARTRSGQAPAALSGRAKPEAADRLTGRPRVNCFTPGTLIATPRGAAPIETLAPGDMVITRDNGPQEIRWAGRQDLAGPTLRVDNRLHPVLIRAGALGPGLPDRDLLVSPNHRLLLLGDHPGLDVAEAEVFVSARHLVGTRGVGRAAVAEVSYLHVMFDRHEVVLSNGAWTESFRPNDDALDAVSDRAREELFAIFPDLAQGAARGRFAPARRTVGAGGFAKFG